MKKILILMLIASLAHAAQQLEKPKLSCMAKIGLPTLGDRLAIIQAERNNFLETQEPKHRKGFQEQVIAIHQLSADQRATLLNDYGEPNWQNNFTHISKQLKERNKWDNRGKCLVLGFAVVVFGSMVSLEQSYYQPSTQGYRQPMRMHPRFG